MLTFANMGKTGKGQSFGEEGIKRSLLGREEVVGVKGLKYVVTEKSNWGSEHNAI